MAERQAKQGSTAHDEASSMDLGGFLCVLYRLTIGLRHRIDEQAFLDLTSMYSAGEWALGLDVLVAEIKASRLPLYELEHADLTRVWTHVRDGVARDRGIPADDVEDLSDIATVAAGESPSGNGVVYNYGGTSPHTGRVG